MDVAKTCGLRGIAKAEGGELDGVLVLIKKVVFGKLVREGSVVIKQIDNMPGKIEFIFKPLSATVLNERAEFNRLGSGFFR